jgi:hypothetical protein
MRTLLELRSRNFQVRSNSVLLIRLNVLPRLRSIEGPWIPMLPDIYFFSGSICSEEARELRTKTPFPGEKSSGLCIVAAKISSRIWFPNNSVERCYGNQPEKVVFSCGCQTSQAWYVDYHFFVTLKTLISCRGHN